tara:strand:- start:200 stop:436 length:237 start_codon:yes stop_codon:yes gene_type:complete
MLDLIHQRKVFRRSKMSRPKKSPFDGRVETLRKRYLAGQDIWTGKPLEGEELAEWQTVMGLKTKWEEVVGSTQYASKL